MSVGRVVVEEGGEKREKRRTLEETGREVEREGRRRRREGTLLQLERPLYVCTVSG